MAEAESAEAAGVAVGIKKLVINGHANGRAVNGVNKSGCGC